ncbi:50S ribosomal protein L35 [Patescibacteria group bacterium]|nr:50S ribosomal protein L35 [Patescibacteria group bacterium]MBU1721870.1 50S ribosomal protein L35 [Patescibacteria group bacterium]MBU1901328.1 50S ribosomal protein L35 [Patescibacteria group bacterium]
MPKIKTHKATAKRFRATKPKDKAKVKFMHATGGRGHFNGKESGNTGTAKRTDASAVRADVSTIKRSMPYAA